MTGRAASVADARTWGNLGEAQQAVDRDRLAGVGVVLDAARDNIVGIDLDACRDAVTGVIAPWAMKIIRSMRSYAEVSPSGTGVKILVRVDPVPILAASKRTIGKINGSKAPAVEIYTQGRYFALTGRILDDVPDEITDATEYFERLAAWVAKAKPAPKLPSAFLELLERDPQLRQAWEKGGKLGSGGDTSASGLDFTLARYLRRDLDDNDLEAVLRAHAHGQIGTEKLRGKAADRRIEILAELPPRSASRESVESVAAAGRNVARRPVIHLHGGGLAEHADAAEMALAEATAREPTTGIYARGSLLVRPVRVHDAPEGGSIRRAAGSLQLLPVDPDYLRVALTRLARFRKCDRRSDAWLDVDAPKDLAKAVLAAAPWPALPRLVGIIEAPTLRPNGTLLDSPGYDQATGLLFDPGGTIFASIPTYPSRADATAALATLHDVLADFPFADDISRSVAISAQITGCAPLAPVRPLGRFHRAENGQRQTFSRRPSVISRLAVRQPC